jgi:hypothetical protein
LSSPRSPEKRSPAPEESSGASSGLLRQCHGQRRAGGPCDAPVTAGSGYQYWCWHDPAVSETERTAWVALGGATSGRPKVWAKEPVQALSTRRAAVTLLSRIVMSALCGELDHRIARVAIDGISAARGWHSDDIAARLLEAEDAVASLAKRAQGVRVLP